VCVCVFFSFFRSLLSPLSLSSLSLHTHTHTHTHTDHITLLSKVVTQLIKGGPAGLKLTKELINRVPDMTSKEAFAWTGEISPKMFTSPEGLQGIKAFRNRTDPPWIPAKL